MTRRLTLLCTVFVLGLLVLGWTFLRSNGVSDWTDAFSSATTQPSRRDVANGRARTTRPARRPATTPVLDSGTTLMRELPRQALLITAAHDYQLPIRDHVVDFRGSAPDLKVSCDVSYDWVRPTLRIVTKTAGKELRQVDLAVTMLEQQSPDYAKLAAAVVTQCDFASALAAAGYAAKPPTNDANLPTPQGVDDLLTQIDPQRAFLAANLLHREIAATGESAQRLAALVRAYSQLGESTRYLYSAHGSAFFARALIYAERLAAKHPDLPLSHAARGYAYTLLGDPMEGRRALAKARELAGANAQLPAWAALADDLAHFRTRALFDRVDGGADSALASYFALLTVEHSSSQALVINLSRLALQNNPGALRVINIMNDNSGVALQHETTAQSMQAQFDLLARLGSEDEVPHALESAADKAAENKFSPPALLKLLDHMDKETAEPGQLLPWSAYASISRDALFVSGFRRLYFTDHMLAMDAGDRLQAWWPILKDHRFAPIIAGFDRTGKLASRETVAKVRGISLDNIWGRMIWMCGYVKKLDLSRWSDDFAFNNDETVYDVVRHLWIYKGQGMDAVPLLGLVNGAIGKSLNIMCPDHPSAVAELIVNRWSETRPRAADIEREMGGHPQVAYALARAYRSEKRYADAARLLEQVIQVSPDRAAYSELAEMYKEQGDDDKWLAVYDKYLSSTEEFGLEQARKSEQIAYALMRMKKFDKAEAYAKRAADSYSAWGLECYAVLLTETRRFAEAEVVAKARQERYPNSFSWYRWCQTTGRGDLKAARELANRDAPEAEASSGGALNEVAIILELEGQIERARACWEKPRRSHDPYDALQLAMLDLAEGKTAAAVEWLESANTSEVTLPPQFLAMVGNQFAIPDQPRKKIYRVTIEEARRCLEDPKAAPSRGVEVKEILEAVESPYRTNAAYFLGRICELRGLKDDAKWWYRTALETLEWNASCRPQAAAGLRRLGEEYYK